eukprot:TRINITY_DN16299_c0_g1_i1.p1 TRINITY_DN16299_c0_g1~~TRINITY_DN16299_c0_g1_i1.p1  ORF type:complete len:693 (+),score=141.87 TRINITY_DN16299_c0_g1_i1:68-2080(+)
MAVSGFRRLDEWVVYETLTFLDAKALRACELVQRAIRRQILARPLWRALYEADGYPPSIVGLRLPTDELSPGQCARSMEPAHERHHRRLKSRGAALSPRDHWLLFGTGWKRAFHLCNAQYGATGCALQRGPRGTYLCRVHDAFGSTVSVLDGVWWEIEYGAQPGSFYVQVSPAKAGGTPCGVVTATLYTKDGVVSECSRNVHNRHCLSVHLYPTEVRMHDLLEINLFVDLVDPQRGRKSGGSVHAIEDSRRVVVPSPVTRPQRRGLRLDHAHPVQKKPDYFMESFTVPVSSVVQDLDRAPSVPAKSVRAVLQVSGHGSHQYRPTELQFNAAFGADTNQEYSLWLQFCAVASDGKKSSLPPPSAAICCAWLLNEAGHPCGSWLAAANLRGQDPFLHLRLPFDRVQIPEPSLRLGFILTSDLCAAANVALAIASGTARLEGEGLQFASDIESQSCALRALEGTYSGCDDSTLLSMHLEGLPVLGRLVELEPKLGWKAAHALWSLCDSSYFAAPEQDVRAVTAATVDALKRAVAAVHTGESVDAAVTAARGVDRTTGALSNLCVSPTARDVLAGDPSFAGVALDVCESLALSTSRFNALSMLCTLLTHNRLPTGSRSRLRRLLREFCAAPDPPNVRTSARDVADFFIPLVMSKHVECVAFGAWFLDWVYTAQQ